MGRVICTLEQCRSAGVRVYLDGARVEWEAPRGVMTVTWLRALKANQEEIRDLLGRQPKYGEPRSVDRPPADRMQRRASTRGETT